LIGCGNCTHDRNQAPRDQAQRLIMEHVVNINVGVLGHVDSGKTSIVAALSEVLSVAALDKHPQSQERGITLDIGLSAFRVCSDEPFATHMHR
jgi:translation elongation factor EF-Tu-like GTPase